MNTLSCPEHYTSVWNKFVVPHIDKIKNTIYNHEYCINHHYYKGFEKYEQFKKACEKYMKMFNTYPPNMSADVINAIINEDRTYFIIEYFKTLKDSDYNFK